MLIGTRSRDYGLWHDIDGSEHKHKGRVVIQSEAIYHDESLPDEQIPNRPLGVLPKHERSRFKTSHLSEPLLNSDRRSNDAAKCHKRPAVLQDDNRDVSKDVCTTLRLPSDGFQNWRAERRKVEDIPFVTLSLQGTDEDPNHLLNSHRGNRDHRSGDERRSRGRKPTESGEIELG